MKFITAIAGTSFVYILTNYFIEQGCVVIPFWLQDFNQYCFGVYVFQQFILQILYYKTSLPSSVGPYWIPWVGVIITICGSLLLSWLFSKTRLGRVIL